MSDETRLREVFRDDFFHAPVNVFDLVERCDRVQRSECLRQMEHEARIEEFVFVLPPEVAAFAAEIFSFIFVFHDFARVFHLAGNDVFSSIEAEHEIGAFVQFHAEDFADMRDGFRFVIQADGARLEAAAHQFRASGHRRVEIFENICAEFASFRLWMNLKCDFRDDAERAFAAHE